MLSTPPAFILSQDQTLKLKFVSLSHFTDSFFASLFTLVILLILPDNWIDLGFGFFQLFSFQGSMSFLFRFPLSPSAKFILPDSSAFVNSFFHFFLFYFFELFLPLYPAFCCPRTPVRFSQQQLVIILLSHVLSIPFLKLFSTFLFFFIYTLLLNSVCFLNPCMLLCFRPPQVSLWRPKTKLFI